jgi:hypothetical protein
VVGQIADHARILVVGMGRDIEDIGQDAQATDILVDRDRVIGLGGLGDSPKDQEADREQSRKATSHEKWFWLQTTESQRIESVDGWAGKYDEK